MPGSGRRSPGRLTAEILLLILAGTPLVAYLWETLNRLLAGVVQPARLLISLPILLAFLGLLHLMSRVIPGWERERSDTGPRTPRPT